MSAAISLVPSLRPKPRRGGPQAPPGAHHMARPITLPLDLSDLLREWERAEDARLVANAKMRAARSHEARSAATRSADAAAYRVAKAREAFGCAVRLAAEGRR